MARRVMIVGCGRLGASVATELLERGDHVTILDTDAENFRRLRPHPRLKMRLGDGVSHETLRSAGIESAESFVAATGQDTTNALAAQSARVTFGVPNVVCRINDQVRSEMYKELGLTTVSPNQAVLELMLAAVGS